MSFVLNGPEIKRLQTDAYRLQTKVRNIETVVKSIDFRLQKLEESMIIIAEHIQSKGK